MHLVIELCRAGIFRFPSDGVVYSGLVFDIESEVIKAGIDVVEVMDAWYMLDHATG